MPDLDAAHTLAISTARDIISEDVRKGVLALSPSIEIADAEGNVLMVISFAEALATC